MLYKLDSILKERALTYQQILRNFNEKNRKKKGNDRTLDPSKKKP